MSCSAEALSQHLVGTEKHMQDLQPSGKASMSQRHALGCQALPRSLIFLEVGTITSLCHVLVAMRSLSTSKSAMVLACAGGTHS